MNPTDDPGSSDPHRRRKVARKLHYGADQLPDDPDFGGVREPRRPRPVLGSGASAHEPPASDSLRGTAASS